MKLRELFESKQPTVGIIFGRFNPPHQGHRAAWEMASENDAWFVGTNKSTQGPKDPLPYDIKIQAMEAIYPEIRGHILPETSWLTMASQIYRKYKGAVLNVYTDEEWVSKALNQYNGVEGPHGFYNFKFINTRPTPRLSSATALRTAVQAGNRDAFADAAGVPADTPVAGHAFFDLVAHYLAPHAAKEKAKAAKKTKKEVEVESTGDKRTDPAPSKEFVSNKFYVKFTSTGIEFTRNGELVYKKSGDYSNPTRGDYAVAKRITTRLWEKEQDTKVGEEAAGVGIITKQNTTVDVNKNTPKKNLKAFRLA